MAKADVEKVLDELLEKTMNKQILTNAMLKIAGKMKTQRELVKTLDKILDLEIKLADQISNQYE